MIHHIVEHFHIMKNVRTYNGSKRGHCKVNNYNRDNYDEIPAKNLNTLVRPIGQLSAICANNSSVEFAFPLTEHIKAPAFP